MESFPERILPARPVKKRPQEAKQAVREVGPTPWAAEGPPEAWGYEDGP